MVAKHFKVIVLLLVVIFLVVGCSPGGFFEEEETETDEFQEGAQSEEENLRETVFYYLYQGAYLVPVERSIPWEEGIARATISRLASSQQVDSFLNGTGLNAPLPAGTEIIGLTIRDGLALIDFSENILEVREGQERAVLDAVVYTLTEFDTVDQVEIQVEGKPLEEFPKGVMIEQPLDRERGINLEVSDEVEDLRATSKVLVYFCGRGEEAITYIVPVTRVIPETTSAMEAALEELIKGPKPGSQLFSELDSRVEINSFLLEDGLATIDFSEEFMAFHGGATSEENILRQVALTLAQFPEINAVSILVEGEEPELTRNMPIQIRGE